MDKYNNQPIVKNGFTLIEMSVVLVIMGLIIGSILVGNSMIRASELRHIITQYESFRSAVYAFKSKYNSLPGDMPDAQSYWGAAADCSVIQTTEATCNGNGNNIVNQFPPSGTIGNEVFLFWKHLSNAGLIQGNYSDITGGVNDYSATSANSPTGKVNNSLWFATNWSYKNATSWAFNGPYYSTFEHGLYFLNGDPVNGMITPAEAFALDSKNDDGRPGTGIMRVRIVGTCSVKADGVTPATYSDTITAQYNTSVSTNQCVLIFPKAY